MKASILREPCKLEIVDIQEPNLGPKDVLVKVQCVGICGTDVSVYRGVYKAKENVILGHEYCGEVVEVGNYVTKYKPGDIVSSGASWGCGRCLWCEQGETSYCDAPNMLGRTVDGSLAEYILLPESVLYKLEKGTTPIEGQAVVGVSTSLRAVNRAGICVGDKVLVIGPGYNGLIIAQLCKMAGAYVGVAGTRDERLSISRQVGADFTVNVNNQDWESELLAKEARKGFDVVIEAAGTATSLHSAIKLVKKGGNILEYGTSFDTMDGLPQKDFYTREISIIGSKGGFAYYHRAIDLLSQKRILLDPLITHQFTLDQAGRAFEIVDNRLDNVLRAVVFC